MFPARRYWSVFTDPVIGSYVEFGIEAKVPASSWVGLGVSANQTQFEMQGSDVTAVGVLPSKSTANEGFMASPNAFAADMSVTAMQTCTQVAGGFVGVCMVS